MGDFNCDLLKNNFYSKKFREIICSYGMYQLVTEPTRVTNTSATLIDCIITNDKYAKHNNYLTPKIGDHNILSFVLDYTKSNECKIIKYRSIEHYDSTYLQNELMKTVWDNSCSDVNVLADKLIDDIAAIVNNICPITERRVTLKHQNKKWINSSILEKIKNKDLKYKAAIFSQDNEQWEEYKKLRNEVNQLIKNEKERYFFNILDENRCNSKELWKNLKLLMPENKRSLNIQNHILFQNVIIEEEDIIAEKFNCYFVNSITDVVNSVTMVNGYDNILSNVDANSGWSEFKKLDMIALKQYIRKLKYVNGGENGISTKIFTDASMVAANRILDVINLSLQEGKFPKNWKKSTIIPIPKVPKTNKCEEFRPINTLPVYVKLLELVVKNQLNEYCDRNNVISECQSGFRTDHSCETVITYICDKWVRVLDENKLIVAVSLDLRRAFETVDRSLLLKKFAKFGFSGKVLQWFDSYLNNREQAVKFGNSVSSAILCDYGVPQGTVLGPIMFNLYMNDIIKYVKNSEMCMFADDMLLYIAGDNLKSMTDAINGDLANIHSWLCDNRLSLNTNKCKYIVIGNKSRTVESNNTFRISVNNVIIEQVNEMKYLGVFIDQNLSFKKHCHYIAGKISRKINFLSRISNSISVFTKSMLYKSLILPHLNFCSNVLFNLPLNEIGKLQKLQNRAMRVILKCNRYTPVSLMLETLDFLNVKQHITYRTLDFVYKIKHNMVPNYLTDRVKYVCSIHNYTTRARNANDFYIAKCNTTKCLNNLYAKGFILFNNLDISIKSCDNYHIFRKLLYGYIKKCI